MYIIFITYGTKTLNRISIFHFEKNISCPPFYLRIEYLFNANAMVFILDGCSFHYAHTWSKSGISICLRHSVTSKESSNPIIFGRDLTKNYGINFHMIFIDRV